MASEEDIYKKIGIIKFCEEIHDNFVLRNIIREDTEYPREHPLNRGNILNVCLQSRDKPEFLVIRNIDKSKFEIIQVTQSTEFYSRPITYVEITRNLILVKIKSYEKSSALYGYGKTKRLLYESGELCRINKILPEYSSANGEINDVIELIVKGRSVKFDIDDLEFIYPPIKTIFKGYTFPMNRKVCAGSNIKVIKKNHLGLEYGIKGTVKELIKAGHKKYCKVEINNKVHTIEQRKVRVIK